MILQWHFVNVHIYGAKYMRRVFHPNNTENFSVPSGNTRADSPLICYNTNLLRLFKEIRVVYFRNYAKFTNMLCEKIQCFIFQGGSTEIITRL
jgi:hypothetical protein